MRKIIIPVVLIALALLFLWRTDRGDPGTTASNTSIARTSEPKTRNAEPRIDPSERSPLADELNAPASDVRADLRIISTIIETYRTNFLREGNPTGTNAEITAALAGDNRLRLALIPRDHPAINREGELCDRWGTPFFFHAESGTQMEIRSAGPDRKHHTVDDAVWSP